MAIVYTSKHCCSPRLKRKIMKVVVRFTVKQEAKALPIILRHSAGMVLPERTYILPEAVLKSLRADGIKFTEIGRDAEGSYERGVLSGERI
jgi:hypothetical protein